MMKKYIKNLNSREKNLILISITLVILLIVFFLYTNIYTKYSISKQKLYKAEDEYVYVFNKAKILESYQYKNQDLNLQNIENTLINKLDAANFKELMVINGDDDSISINLKTDNLNSAILISQQVDEFRFATISKIELKKNDNEISLKIYLSS
tara:strand:- start:3034 stop:3492 length:459 start_codon:yes stop_codon:yes gene_type:complete